METLAFLARHNNTPLTHFSPLPPRCHRLIALPTLAWPGRFHLLLYLLLLHLHYLLLYLHLHLHLCLLGTIIVITVTVVVTDAVAVAAS